MDEVNIFAFKNIVEIKNFILESLRIEKIIMQTKWRW